MKKLEKYGTNAKDFI